ncbi:nucleotidyl transferase AbiEii/AbiGii toxin family protein [Streptomyces sp. NPDC058200]|uniref:nucleotidyl transferase AbiEii/AbiGii toxin family protein n=1 Tax=Streptomyces sp. NPDC058200 TaxID=3346378 RepID=UPI0036EB7324
MVSAWEKFGYGPWDNTETVPKESPADVVRARMGLPGTLRPVPGEGVVQRPVFDPAAAHHARGMRLSEPRFADARREAAWFAGRRQALDHALAAVAGSRWTEHLVLRGSRLLTSWFGDAARDPGDLDFVVVPDTWELTDPRTDTMLNDLASTAEALSRAGGPVRIDAAGALSDEIWTYDRVPGRRLVLPWTAVDPAGPDAVPPSMPTATATAEALGGTVQLDFVFNEPLPAPPAMTAVAPLRGGADLVLNAATRELSLAWKILWLVSDVHPEAKDLYDAILLAETTDLSEDLLHRVFRMGSDTYYHQHPVGLDDLAQVEADWFEFGKDYPDFPGNGADQLARLLIAVAPTFVPSADSPYECLADWLAPRTEAHRTVLAESGMDAVQSHLVDRRSPAVVALVITRELLGRAACDLSRAADLVAAFRTGAPVVLERARFLGDPHTAAEWLARGGSHSEALARRK